MPSLGVQIRAFAWWCYPCRHCWGQLQAAYAPLYKADARAEAQTIESPFSQTLTVNSQETKSQTAAETPVNMCKSMSLEVRGPHPCMSLRPISRFVVRPAHTLLNASSAGLTSIPSLVNGLMLPLCM